MLSYPAALDILTRACSPLPARRIGLADAPGAVAAEDVRAGGPLPAFANAAMDGYALASSDTARATPETPARLAVAGRVAAGQAAPGATPPGAAWLVMTGAPMPAGCDAVVPVERSRAAAGSVEVDAPLAPGQNRRAAGEDYAAGDLVLAAGAPVTAEAVMALAATGHDAIGVRGPARVAVITTGDELAGGPAGVRDANGPYLAACLAALGARLVSREAIGDDPAALVEALGRAAPRVDLVLTTGGVSAGELDFVPGAVARLGAQTLFHKVAIRPGKPLLAARLQDGPLILGLPGNPIAAAVGLRFFAVPALRALTGLPPERFARARLAAPVRNRRGLSFFAKALATAGDDATLRVAVLQGQESFRIAPLAAANCWALVPEGTEEVAAGSLLAVAPLLPAAFPVAGG
jgi:molybdopterin molybdotransferase